MAQTSMAEALNDIKQSQDAVAYPYVRRDRQVRARLLGNVGQDRVLIETWYEGCKHPVKRCITLETFENNYWEGKD